MVDDQQPPSLIEAVVVEENLESLESRMSAYERTVTRSLIFLFIKLEFAAVIYAYLGTRWKTLSWRAKAIIKILPVFLVPALAYFFYILFCRFKRMLNLRESILLQRIRRAWEAKIQELKMEMDNNYVARRPIQNYIGENSSSASASGSSLPKISSMEDQTDNPTPEHTKDQIFQKLPRTSATVSSTSVTRKTPISLSMEEISSNNQKVEDHELMTQVPVNPTDSSLLGRKEPEAKIQELIKIAAMPTRLSMASSSGSTLPEISDTEDNIVDLNLSQVKNRQVHLDTSTDPDAHDSTFSDENGKKKLRNSLICSTCSMDNGFAKNDELPFISYKCPRCKSLNGPHKEQKGHDSASTSVWGVPVISVLQSPSGGHNPAPEPVVKEMESTVSAINPLPEECISYVIALTTPKDACVSSVVSHAFRSAADSDATWQRFLPSDWASFLSQAVHRIEYASMKELYFRLCDHPLLVDNGLMRFGLEKLSGAKIFMISARRLSIAWVDDIRYWEWIALHEDSRFRECARLKGVCWLDISGRINSEILTANISYSAYLVYKLSSNARSLSNPFQTTKVTVAGDTVSQHSVCLNPAMAALTSNVVLPTHREDGWFEVQLGSFYSGDRTDGEVVMSFTEKNDNYWKSGLIVHGFEVRPTH